MRIDFHTHFFPDRIAAQALRQLSDAGKITPQTDGTAAGLARSMERAGIDMSVNLPVMTSPAQTERVNDSLLRGREEMSRMGILSFGGIHPGYEDFRGRLRMLAQEGVKGIKLHPAYQRTDLDDPVMMRIIDEASSLGLIVLVHAGLDIGIPGHNYADVRMALRVIDEVRPERFVLAHMGGWNGWEDVSRYIAGADVWLDTAFSIGRIDFVPDADPAAKQQANMTQEAFLSLCRKHGMNRILFGTDCPWADQKQYVDAVCAMPMSEEEKEAVLGGNAASLLGL